MVASNLADPFENALSFEKVKNSKGYDGVAHGFKKALS